MMLCHQPVEAVAGVFALCCAASNLYWFNKICEEVNLTLPKEHRVEGQWKSFVMLGSLRQRWRQDWTLHRVWNEHVRLYPKSRKRLCVGISFLLFFLVPIVSVTICLLQGSS